MKKTIFQQIVELNEAGGFVPLTEKPVEDSFELSEHIKKGLRHIQSEIDEADSAMRDQNIMGVVDGFADMIVFAVGEIWKLGVDPEHFLQSVLDSQMTKFAKTPAEIADAVNHFRDHGVNVIAAPSELGVMFRAQFGCTINTVYYEKDKWLKPPCYKAAECVTPTWHSLIQTNPPPVPEPGNEIQLHDD